MYHTAFAFSVKIVVMLIQQLLTNTVGVMNASSSNRSWKEAVLDNFPHAHDLCSITGFALSLVEY